MKNGIVIFGFIVASTCFCISCSKMSSPSKGVVSTPSAPCIIYKTKVDYSKNLPVILSADKSRLISFPDVEDIKRQGENVYPTQLDNGYLLDNRGIGPDVIFLTLTYKEYSSLEKTPEAAELMSLILDRDPVTEMYRCGNRSDYKDIVADLNEWITSGQLSRCQRIK